MCLIKHTELIHPEKPSEANNNSAVSVSLFAAIPAVEEIDHATERREVLTKVHV